MRIDTVRGADTEISKRLATVRWGRTVGSTYLIRANPARIIPIVESHLVDACLDPRSVQVLFNWTCSGKVFCWGSFSFSLSSTRDIFLLHFWRNKITVPSVSAGHVDNGTGQAEWDLTTAEIDKCQSRHTTRCAVRLGAVASVVSWLPNARNASLLLGRLNIRTILYAHFYNSVKHSPPWEANNRSASEEIFPTFMEPEGSLPYSQEPATCPYPEPDISNPPLPTLFP
jgi:hypothetical protein